jgi:hypothetical protein
MAIDLTHMGEAIMACMIDAMRWRFIEFCNLSGQADQAFVSDTSRRIVFPNVGLAPYSGIGFDGASCVDLAVLIRPGVAVPFELKLGETRLTKTRVDEEWLPACALSHGGKRFSGNMMAILERKFPASVSAGALSARVDGGSAALTEEWFVVARSSVLKKWTGNARPAFSTNVRTLGFESIVAAFGGREPFNAMVRDLLNFDYYAAWVGNP